ncbi:MAG TPA: hypothetical protein VG055_01225 [Planctomycetaceae bacterium]|jgi:hypothetical protein|nr:hypothetical protein [Planctomycetaceae bacterium]
MATLNLNGDRLIRLPLVDSKSNYLDGFWRWVELLAADDYKGALEALLWPNGTSWTPEALKKRVTTFFGGDAPWSVVVPNDRLVGVINDDAEFQPRNREGWGWFMAQVPVTTEPADPKNDKIPLMGLASSFFVRERDEQYVLEFEIFHL